MTFGSGAPPGELINLIFFVCRPNVSTMINPICKKAKTYKTQAQVDGWTFSDFIVLQSLIVCQMLDIFHDHGSLS
jgi:hypothetical protein